MLNVIKLWGAAQPRCSPHPLGIPKLSPEALNRALSGLQAVLWRSLYSNIVEPGTSDEQQHPSDIGRTVPASDFDGASGKSPPLLAYGEEKR